MIWNFISLAFALITIVSGSVTAVILAIKEDKGGIQFACAIGGCIMLAANLYVIHMGIQ